MLSDEMIEQVRAQASALGKTARAIVLIRPKLAAKADRVMGNIIKEFASHMKQGGLSDEDIEVLCEVLMQAYRAELPVRDVTKH